MNISRIEQWVTPRNAARFGAALTLLLFIGGYVVSLWNYRQGFLNDATLKSSVVMDVLVRRTGDLEAAQRALGALGRFDRDQFREVVLPLASHPGILSVDWVSVESVASRPDSYPITFRVPQAEHDEGIGFNVGSDPERRAALHAAEENGGTCATAPFKLVGRGEGSYGIFLYTPVYNENRKLHGFVQVTLQPNDLFRSAFRSTAALAIDTAMVDLSGSSRQQTLYSFKVPDTIAGQLPGLDDLLFPLPTYTQNFTYADRQWRITCTATRGYHSSNVSLIFLLILPIGLLFTRLCYQVLRQKAVFYDDLETKVQERTFLLMRAKREWEHTFDTVPDLIMVLGCDCRIIRVNRAQAERLGVCPAELVGQRFCGAMQCGDAAMKECRHHQFLVDGKQHFVEAHLPGMNGDFFISITPLHNEEGELVGAVHVARDIAERKRKDALLQERTDLLLAEITTRRQIQEQMLNHQQQLETLNRELEERIDAAVAKNRKQDQILVQNEKLASIGQLAAGVAHEINNPMAFISSNLETLKKYFNQIAAYDRFQQEQCRQSVPPVVWESISAGRKEQKISYLLEDGGELVDEAVVGAERVSRIVNILRSYSGVDIIKEYESVFLPDCLENVLSICVNELAKNATIHKEYGNVPNISGNPGQLNQVFMSLLLNAGQAMTEQGVITLKCWSEKDSVCVSVSDTGHGIPTELLGRIFEPFFTTRDVGGGAGLGLSSSYQIVKNHHGMLQVVSEVDKGSTFTVTFPPVQQEIADISTEPAS